MLQRRHRQQIIFEMAGYQKILFDVLVSVFSHPLAQLPVLEQLRDATGGAFHRMHQEPRSRFRALRPVSTTSRRSV